MGIFDKAKDLIGQHNDKIDQGIDKVGDLIDQRTGGAHGERIDSGSETLKGHLDRLGGTPETPAADVPADPAADVPTTPATDLPADEAPANQPPAGPPVS